MQRSRPNLCSRPFMERLLRLLSERGEDAMALAARAGLDPAALAVAGGALPVDAPLFPLDAAVRFYAVARDHLGDPLVGLHAALHADTSAVGTVGFILQQHPTLREGLDDIYAITGALIPEFRIRMDDLSSGRRYEISLDLHVDGHDEALTEIVCAGVIVPQAISGGFTPRSLEIPGPTLPVQPFVDALGVAPTFGHAHAAFVVPHSALLHPFPRHDTNLLVHLHEAVEQQVRARRQRAGLGADLVPLVGCTIDLGLGEIRRDLGTVGLTEREHQLLSYFVKHRNQVVTHTMLEQDVWSLDRDEMSFAPAVAIRRVRQKLEVDPGQPINLVTVFGEGWKLVVPD